MVRATIDLGCIIKKSPTAEGAVGVIVVGKGDGIRGKRRVQRTRCRGGH